MNFGKWIFVAFIMFTLFIATLVVICVRQDISLVSKEYYKDELAYQSKLDRLNNTQHLAVKPEISMDGSDVVIRFPQSDKIESGRLRLLRPSDARLDQQFELKAGVGDVQRFNLPVWGKGLYRASLEWKMEGTDYYFEKIIVL